MASWVSSGWVAPNWVESDTITPGAGVPITLPDPGFVHGATNFGDLGAIQLIYHQNPGPYSDEAILIVKTWAGQRLFGAKMPADVILADDIGRYATLLDVQPLAINTVPLGNDLIGSIGTTESPQLIVTLDNRRKFWSRLVMVEPLLAMPAGVWLHYGAGEMHLVFLGQIERVVLRQETCELTISEP